MTYSEIIEYIKKAKHFRVGEKTVFVDCDGDNIKQMFLDLEKQKLYCLGDKWEEFETPPGILLKIIKRISTLIANKEIKKWKKKD